MNQQFLPFLTDDIGRSLDVENKVVVTRSLPDPLENSPDGWENNTIQFARNNEFRGVIKSYTTSLKFYLDGATILRNAFYRFGMETVLFFIWLKLDQSFGGGMTYKSWYKGEPDLGTFKDEYDGVSVNITEGGFFKDLQANKTVPQEIPFDDDAVSLYMDGMILNQIAHYGITDGLATGQHRFIGDLPFLSTEGDNSSGVIADEIYEALPDTAGAELTALQASDNYFFFNDGTQNIPITVSGVAKFRGATTDPFVANGITFFVKKNRDNLLGQAISYQLFTQALPYLIAGTYEFTYSVSFTANPGDKLFFVGNSFVNNDYYMEFLSDSTLDISFPTRSPATIIQAYRAITLGDKLSKKMSTGSTLTSPLLGSDFNLLITSGDEIRNLPGAVIKSSFSDWHKSIDAVKCIALSVENNNPVVSSRYDKFDKTSQIADLGECSDWSLQPADEYIYDTVAVGYPSKSADSNIDLNGRNSFNNTFIWGLPVTRRKVNQYDAVSRYYADPYDIELIRLNLGGKTTTTGSSDNRNFFLDGELLDFSFSAFLIFTSATSKITFVAPGSTYLVFFEPGVKFMVTGTVSNDRLYHITAVLINGLNVELTVAEFIPVDESIGATFTAVDLYKLRRLPYTTITGIPNDGSVFNIELSPRRILSNHLRWLRSSFDHFDLQSLIFKTTEKNKELVTTDAGGNVIDEDAAIPISSMGDKVYLPYYTTFEVASPQNLLDLLTANNSGKFDYSMGGVTMDGFPIEIKSMDATLETQDYKLLMTANNVNIRLINDR